MRFSLVFLVSLAATASAQSDCANTSFYGPSGVISSPNYPGYYYDFLNCTYNIYGSNDTSFTLVFQSFSTESFDKVTISCLTNSSFPPQTYSGTLLPNPISVPWCSQARVRFTTDFSIVSTGFSLDYSVGLGGCGNTVYGDSHGYVGSPGYPDRFGPNQNCSSIIYASQQSHFHLRFLVLSMPGCSTCTCYWVEISCYDNNPSDKRRFCGESVIAFDIFQCTQVLVWFHSESGDPTYGFYLEYFIFPDGGTDTGTGTGSSMSYTSSRTSSRTSGSSWSTTDFSTRFTGPSTQTPPVVDCGNTDYFGPSGVISSPNHPDDYPNYLACDYYITASSSSSSIALIFKEFDTEKCCDFVTISCPTNSSHPSVTYSGFSLPQPFSIALCSKGAINFSTNDATVNTGFTLDYHISLGGCGDTVFTGSHGYVSSPYYPSNYGDNQNCSNIIWASQRSSFAITFQYMSVEECCDYVELSCLDNAEFGSHRFTGTTIPDKLEIPGCTQVLVWFNSDDSVAQTGFNLEYLVTPEQVFAV